MEQPNYFETVAMPALQQKCQEFFNLSLALETNLRIEVAKNKFLHTKLEEYEKQNKDLAALQAKQDELDSKNQITFRKMQELEQAYSQLQIDYQNLNKATDGKTFQAPVAKVVKTIKGKVSKAVRSVPPTFTEPDDF
jgi:hypothetical protein